MAASAEPRRGAATERLVRAALLGGWLAMPAFVLLHGQGCRIFWTVLVALLPFAWVVLGFHAWRRNCPLAAIAQLPRRLGREGQRRIDGRWASAALLVQLGGMLVCLCLRLLGANGTPLVLACLLVALSCAALASGFLFRGKTWCNHLCPVGLVEKIYTEPVALVPSGSSQCERCTACKKNCPDIDLEQGYWKESQEPARRLAYFAWPGVVLGFYTWFWLRTGDWQSYFGGAWTTTPTTLSDLRGPGLWFAKFIPWAASPALTLIAFGGASLALFGAGERFALARGADPTRTRHRALVLAGFVAISLFYVFAGQPTLRLAPDWVRQAVVFCIWLGCALIFFRRWIRSERDFVRERFAKRILARWTEGEAPDGSDLNEVYVVHEERQRQRQARLAAYGETLRELANDGVLTRDKLSVIEAMRGQLQISEAEHQTILRGLEESDRALFDEGRVASADERLQEEQYRRALEAVLTEAATRGASTPPTQLERLRESWGIAPERHAALLAALQDPEGALSSVVREELQSLERLGVLAAATRRSGLPAAARELVPYLCRHAARPHVERVLALQRSLGRAAPAAAAADLVFGGAQALECLPELAQADSTLARLLGALQTLTSAEVNTTERLPDPPLAAELRACADLAPHGAGVADILEGADSDAARRAERMAALRAVALLEAVGPQELDALGTLATRVRLADGERLCSEGDVEDSVFVLLSGQARVWRAAAPATTLQVCEPGTCVGELAVLDSAPRSANVTALGQVEALVLPGAEFRDMLDRHAAMARGVMRELARRLRRA